MAKGIVKGSGAPVGGLGRFWPSLLIPWVHSLKWARTPLFKLHLSFRVISSIEVWGDDDSAFALFMPFFVVESVGSCALI